MVECNEVHVLYANINICGMSCRSWLRASTGASTEPQIAIKIHIYFLFGNRMLHRLQLIGKVQYYSVMQTIGVF